MAELSDRAHAVYRALVWEEERFPAFFRWFTPVDELALLAIGSRPSRRPESEDFLRSLRAIPWVFAWTQNRCLLPAWYGCGTALGGGDLPELRRLYRSFPFFRSLVENLEMTLAKSRLRDRPRLPPARPAGGRAEAPLRDDRRRARAHRRGRARDRRGEGTPRPSPGRPAIDRAAQPVRRSDERDSGRAAAALPRRAATRRCAGRSCARSQESPLHSGTPASPRSHRRP